MYAILAEDDSDAEVIETIVKKQLGHVRVKRKGYDGCGGLCRKGARDIRRWVDDGITGFIVCHDADGPSSDIVREKVLDAIVRPSGFGNMCCVVVPVQEIEAWLIADEDAIRRVIPTFQLTGHKSPETIESPKEWLIKQSKAANGKPLYSPKTFNGKVARHLRLDLVGSKCPSFRAFLDWLVIREDCFS